MYVILSDRSRAKEYHLQVMLQKDDSYFNGPSNVKLVCFLDNTLKVSSDFFLWVPGILEDLK